MTTREKFRSEYALRLRAARARASMSQLELARLAGCAQNTCSRAESEGRGSAHTASFARVLKVDAYWLETGEGQMEPVADVVPDGAPKPASPFAVVTIAQLNDLSRSNAATVECLVLHLLGQQAVQDPTRKRTA